jgi:hypothetical protein
MVVQPEPVPIHSVSLMRTFMGHLSRMLLAAVEHQRQTLTMLLSHARDLRVLQGCAPSLPSVASDVQESYKH